MAQHPLDADPANIDAFKQSLKNFVDQRNANYERISSEREAASERARNQTPEQRAEHRAELERSVDAFKAKHSPPETPLERMKRLTGR